VADVIRHEECSFIGWSKAADDGDDEVGQAEDEFCQQLCEDSPMVGCSGGVGGVTAVIEGCWEVVLTERLSVTGS